MAHILEAKRDNCFSCLKFQGMVSSQSVVPQDQEAAVSLRTLETRIREIDKALHEVLEEIHQLKENESGSSRQVEIARRMHAARGAMTPLSMSVKDLVDEGRER